MIKLKKIMLIISILSCLLVFVLHDYFIFTSIISFSIWLFLDYKISAQKEGEIIDRWSSIDFDELPKIVKLFFEKSLVEDQEHIFQLNSVVYIAWFSTEKSYEVKEVRSKKYYEEVFVQELNTGNKTIEIDGVTYYYEIIKIWDIWIEPREIKVNYITVNEQIH